MHAFLVAEDFTIQTNRFARRYQGGTLNGPIQVDRLIVDTGGEGDLVRRTLEQHKQNSGKPDEPVQIPDLANRSDEGEEKPQQGPYVTGVAESALLNWPGLPPRLGRVSSRYVGQGLHRHEEPEPLTLQLAALKARFPNKKHWRFVVVNAFGTNLGDCVLGMTAMRSVAKHLGQHLDSFVIDMLLGTNTSAGNFDIVGHEPWIGEVRVTGPTLQEFASYDGYFDFTGLIALPRFTEIPIADWYVWWAGMEPAGVDTEAKRNKLNIPWSVWTEIADVLKGTSGKRVLFNPKASVSLRTFPDAEAASFVQRLLDIDPDLWIVLDRPLNIKHLRVIDLSEKINSPQKFQALIAQLDGVITVDTFAVHVADAAGVPAVGLFASVPPNAYPYYPLHHGMLIPGGESLPAYQKFKIVDENEWEQIKPAYISAWQRLDAREVLNNLASMMAKRQGIPAHQGIRFIQGPHRPELFKQTAHERTLPYENIPANWSRAETRQIDLSKLLVKPGATVIVVAPGKSRFPVALAQHLGREGKMIMFEPRPHRHTLIAMDLLERVPQTPVQWHGSLPAPAKNIDLAIEEPLGETTPLLWGSSRVQKRLPAVTIDSLELPILSAIFMFAPMIFRVAIQSAKATLTRTRANLVCGPIEKLDDVRAIAEELQSLRYQCWVDYIEGRPDGAMMLVAVPDNLNVQAAGMKKVVMK